MSFSLDGHVALVTGSSTGLGKITARNLATAGAKVAVNFANNRERAEESFAEFGFAICPHTATAARAWRHTDLSRR